MLYAVLCLALADRIHGTGPAIVATAYRLRPIVRREIQPVLSRVIRCRDPRAFVEIYLKEL